MPLFIYVTKRLNSTLKHIVHDATNYKLPQNATVFSMIQPTGKFHLGNYLGAVRVWKDITDSNDGTSRFIFGTADLHAMTNPNSDPERFRQLRREAIASILSVGIDPKKAIIFHQSQVPQHSELFWYLTTIASIGSLNRMTQWKSKARIEGSNNLDTVGNVKLGLFAYPVLQAADILLYKSTHVPVGDDQTQHLELTRQLAQSINALFKTKYFPLPTTFYAPSKKILSLLNPEKKMSKSDTNQSAVIYINDEPNIIARKVKRAVTDSIQNVFNYDPVNRPGVSNLINIVSGIQRKSTAEVESDIIKLKSHKDLKDYVTEVIVEELKEPRAKFSRYIADQGYLQEVERLGSERASTIAAKNLKDIKHFLGF
ncbi:tryptophan--tRNA ligase MSW1 Ecym_5499 [Eremothecium cymbalariae DBVPG|uniref:Tryptophan--tRNA ligase, mitochondrial n=1 Tax=Eremothecium cymbalariae (strain CBS 270.75 / DBVPG 7215 / KCTC 17166 / NRRL Y-17582) TaxID=931890 RepID=I6NDV0_ERECY|nr:hypothetical protein Ecym_5499 [Eremothecium cymbalariae DBVPG\